MSETNLLPQLELAVKAAIEAGKLLLKTEDAEVVINSSIGKDIKLAADVESEQLIVKILSEESDFDILSEESGFVKNADAEGYRWIVDPLDGSLNYSRDIDIYCVSIGLWKNNEPVLGVVYDFLHERMYKGLVGTGAFINDKPITVSAVEQKKDSILTTGFPVYSTLDQSNMNAFITNVQEFKKVRLFGSAAMSLVHVAKGSAEAYTENNIALWDVAAGLAILKAAGGSFTAEEGKGPLYLNVYASNGKI
ncbi:inositol monophosphatase [Mucilaginibacter sp. JRF]|uniref:inositol monophosphatase family protein n=1 Tax=Mucilaginibacter sp. JRF TaxID=2780088 RepID=UPI00187F2DDE|nr:inositol monophosphatase [Mucilaginibacter sp. JRF]MBE9585355.1 inositol monophosphatase [Mucilaginibacter sp. JRF]